MTPNKKDLANQIVRRGNLYIHLDPRRPGVEVPPWRLETAHLTLEVGLDMLVPIPDIRFTDEAMTGTLRFNGLFFKCTVPWTAVFALVGSDGRGMTYPECVPPEVQAQMADGIEAAKEPKTVVHAGVMRRLKNGKILPDYLRVVK